ncbi:unnamed protein product [Tetraodon nigroviridis]|uniref:Chromosome 15 SCAF14367, whole genome shotgun sequence n=1 Tax=Tetraodon nigroviridis TaxID=99883 RepID=Q4SSL8_TETNG|nr:unnamed protein product [Tetraodon nigroviridis]
MSGEVYLLWLLSLLKTLSAYGAELSSEACRELGFSSNLLCTSCDLLGEFSLAKLQPNCQQCCQQEALMEGRKHLLLEFSWLLAGCCIPGPFWRCADENWGGSPKSKLLSGVRSQRCSRVFRSSTSEAQTLCSSFWTTKGTLLRSSASSSGTRTAWRSS